MSPKRPTLMRQILLAALIPTACCLPLHAAEPAAKPSKAAAAAPTPKEDKKAEQLQLDASQITGHRGLPRVLYIVPWKRAEADDSGGRPAGSLLDEVLAPVDRTEFRRQLRYYDALNGADSEPAAAGGATP